MEQLLRQRAEQPRVLVVGGSIEGEGSGEFLRSPHLDVVESDVSFGPRTQIVLDSHAIPYADESFDGVVVQAVLEHVLAPLDCVEEIFRVLKPAGLVYSEVPFIQQVHGGPYDFTRFTHSGHRWLFRHFDEIDSGMTAGAGTGLAWSIEYFLLSLLGQTDKRKLAVKGLARLGSFWLKYIDKWFGWNAHGLNAAAGLYFLGQKSEQPLSIQSIVPYYERHREHNLA